ncbi:YfhO family protein [Sporosarcina gallistercoris]|uniref:YfhO family protein n=1 Tax=Sporosarcina gallistercoris TaxID=2762245 RepID=A0ABR8PJ16_9BACL|nr:YfhO family protein [Sporosarcina gallistercoris]MBD7908151.1 YfhO family protein [Sporosarcina gallistercoris]
MMTKKSWIGLILVSALTAAAAHGFMLSEWMQGRYVVGPNDGLSQMIPFKHFLYESMLEGNFFYSERFGLGGGTFSQLGYYFSTSLVFLATAAITMILEWMGILSSPELQYWADVTVFVSMIRLTVILLITTVFFRIIGLKTQFSYIAAVIYGISILYFRHVTYWEFFADAMLFLPLLLIGAERIMRYGKPGWFIAAVVLSMVDNFYFAYINFLLAFIYIVFRWFIPLTKNEGNKRQQIGQFLMGGLLGAAISSPFFVPAVYGYLNNFRPPFEGEIPLFEMTENILSDGKMVVLPAFAVICLFLYPLYKQRGYRLFAIMTVMLAVLHASPAVGSVFNGFSAPQFRWEHMLMLAAGGLVAVTLQNWREIQLKHAGIAAVGTIAVYILFSTMELEGKPSLYADSLVVMALITCALVILAAVRQFKHWNIALWTGIIAFSLITVNLYQEEKLTGNHPQVEQVQGQGIPQSFFTSDAYNGSASRELVQQLTEGEEDPLARIEWMIGTRNNTPIVQNFLGTSIYSSILNQHLLHFYLDDLSIDMGRESVSRYAGFGGRANLYSLLNGVYAIRSDKGNPIPYGFEEVAQNGEFKAFESNHRLPFVRTTNRIYTEEELGDSPAIVREHAMLDGVILDEWNDTSETAPSAENLIDKVTIQPVRAEYENDELVVTGKNGGVDLKVSDVRLLKEDTYVSFNLERSTADIGFHLKVNEYKTTRKRTDSIYRTRVNDITIRIPSEETIRIRVPEGTYTFSDLALYAEDYTTLEKAEREDEQTSGATVEWKGEHADVQLDNSNGDTFAVMPIPFEKGWRAKVNGENVSVQKANYAFTAIPIEPGPNTIEMTYRPPYFVISLWISLLALVSTIVWLVKGIRSKPFAH